MQTKDTDDRYFRSPFLIETTTPTKPTVVRATKVVTLPLMETVSNDVSVIAIFDHEEG